MTQSLIWCGRHCLALRRSAEEGRVQVVDCCDVTWCQTLHDWICFWSYHLSSFNVQRLLPTLTSPFISSNCGKDFESSTLDNQTLSWLFYSRTQRHWIRLWVVQWAHHFFHTIAISKTLQAFKSHRYPYSPGPINRYWSHPPVSQREFVILCQYWFSSISRRFFLSTNMFSFGPVCSFLFFDMYDMFELL